ncbi:transmembrane 220 family protein [Algibacter miyuki]|uniref:Transmembrane 220 family protein n=1 Tax=Algibacter miyuki TaxID=1306933 RepID=A0ABV5GWE9_9FLAO|nr:transmembrane 220 family protein [Algibacter miyuki]MDN3665217.1 transmembrane 220 family protein [Algibacter miyuki]
MNLFFKILGIVFGVLFVFGALVQYNDPDPLLWIILYAIAAAASFGYAANKVSKMLLFALGAAFLVGFFITYPETFEGFEIGKGTFKNVEEGREAYGLLLISIVLFLFGGFSYLRKK